MTSPSLQGLPGTGPQFRGGINPELYVQAANLALHGYSFNRIEQTLRASGWAFANVPFRAALNDIVSSQAHAPGIMKTAGPFQVSKGLFQVSRGVRPQQYTVHLRTTFQVAELNRPLGITLKFNHQPTANEIRNASLIGMAEALRKYEIEETVGFGTLEAYEAYRGTET